MRATGTLRRIQRIWQDFRSKTPIRHGHVYTDEITGERFQIHSVGPQVELERLDAERRSEQRTRKTLMRGAIEEGYVSHNPDACPACDTRGE